VWEGWEVGMMVDERFLDLLGFILQPNLQPPNH
jgi:hypothetical protein